MISQKPFLCSWHGIRFALLSYHRTFCIIQPKRKLLGVLGTPTWPSSSMKEFSTKTNEGKQQELLQKEKFKECFKCSLTHNIHCLSQKCSLLKTIQTKLTEQYNLFEIFNVPISYIIDEKKLDLEYKNLQKNFHPDKYANVAVNRNLADKSSGWNPVEEMKNITELSSAINYAYQTLKSPVHRAEYMIWLVFQKNVFEEGKTLENPSLMMEIFTWRERISDADSADERKLLVQEIQPLISSLQNQFQQSLNEKNVMKSMEITIKLKYYFKMLEELDI